MRHTTSGAVGGAAANDILKLRKELIQARSTIADLQEELEEKTSLYLNAIKARDAYKEKLNNARDNIHRAQDIVQQQVAEGMEAERKELLRLRSEVERLREREAMLDQANRQLTEEKKQLMDKVHGLTDDLGFYARNLDQRESMKRIEALRAEKEAKEKRITDLLQELNTLSNLVEDFTVENRALRQMANVPANFGVHLDKIKLHDKEKIDDFKKLIKVLQDDNYKLEEERARLKHALKVQSMMYKSTDPSERYKDLTQDQLFAVDQFVLQLLKGEAVDTSDFYQLKKENEKLRAQIEVLSQKSFEVVSSQLQVLLKDKGLLGASGDQMSLLLQHNEQIRNMIARLLEQGGGLGGISFGPVGKSLAGQTGNLGSAGLSQYDSRFRDPEPRPDIDGNIIEDGVSHRFGHQKLPVHDTEGKKGITATNLYEHAFLQLQLVESLELIRRKNDSLNAAQAEIESLYKRIKGYLLTQDQLYKDFVRVERNYHKKEEALKVNLRNVQDQLMEEQTKVGKLETALQTLQTGNPDSLQNRLIELTKQNAIFEINLLRLTRKYQCLEEQERLLRREYHAKDEDMAEKDRFTHQRINSLKEWKARAMQQLKFLFEKLRMAVPVSEFESTNKQLNLSMQKCNDLVSRNARLAKYVSDLQKQVRENMEAEENLKHANDHALELEEEIEIVRKRLEYFDPVFRWESEIFQKIATVLQRARVSPQQAFEHFDANKSGTLSRKEFAQALEMLQVTDLSQQEMDVLWGALDTNHDNNVSFNEFFRKLSRYGVKNRSKEEVIIYAIIEAAQRSNVKNLSKLFEMIDKKGRGFISREDFIDICLSLQLKVDKNDLQKFVDHFWKDKEAGIDYPGFLRLFSRYQMKLAQEENARSIKNRNVIVTDETVRMKKDIYSRIDNTMKRMGKTLTDLFAKVDKDGDRTVTATELYHMFQGMQLTEVTQEHARQIFRSIDFDGNLKLSLPEFQADFEDVLSKDVATLIAEQRQRTNMELQQKQSEMIYGAPAVSMQGISQAQIQEIQAKIMIESLKAREQQLHKKLDMNIKVLQNYESALHSMRTSYDSLEEENDRTKLSNFEMKERIITMEKLAKSTIDKDLAEKMAIDNERLRTDLTETRAAMLSYKNMCVVIADQAKNLKLMHERKKDEHDNLMNALREMQSEGVSQERLGKLYFIIMLSRWQEASVNKKYEMILTEVKELRTELMNAQQLCQAKELDHSQAETLVQRLSLDLEKLKQEVNQTKGVYLTQQQANEFNQIIQDLSDSKTDLEETYLRLQGNYRKVQDQCDVSQAKADHAQSLLQTLKNSKQSDLSTKLLDLSEKIQTIRLNELRAKRENEELEERINYITRLLKNSKEQVATLEESASKYEGQMIKQEEEFRKRDNERLKQFFYVNRFEDPTQKVDVGQNIGRSATLTRTQTSHVDPNLIQQSNTHHAKIKDELVGKSQFIRGDTLTGAELKVQQDKMLRLETELQELRDLVDQKDTVIKRFEQWQVGDKYLSQDAVLKEAIDEHRSKTMQVHEKESKEMADAAYQTIKTLQGMLDQKNEQLRKKEDHLQRMREQMTQQRELDAQQINQLREQLSITGNTTLAKLHEVVSRHDITAEHQSRSTQGNQWDRLGAQELQRQLEEKDHMIRQYRAKLEAWNQEREFYSKKSGEKLDEINQLKEELRREKERVDIKAANAKLKRLQKERLEQDETIANLRKAIDSFKDRMVNYENEKVGLADENEVAKKREQLHVVTAQKEIETFKNKITLLQTQRDKKAEEAKELNVKLAEKTSECNRILNEMNELQKKYQSTLSSLEHERRLKGRVTAELNTLKNEHGIGGNVGSRQLSYDALLAQNRELQQEKMVLQTQTKTVVVYNKESGAFEFIGNPRTLSQEGELKTIPDILAELKKWLKANDRLTPGAIFQSLDRGNFGELNEQQYQKAFEKMGIILQPRELGLLKDKLDPKGTKFLKIEPMVRQLAGIPTQEFIIEPLLKLARLVEARDLTHSSLRSLIDPKHEESMDLQQFQKAIRDISTTSDFMMTDGDAEVLFKGVTKALRTTGVTIGMTQLIDEVFYAVHALVIERMRHQLARSGQFLIDLLDKHDKNKDGFLEYAEVENMLLEIQVAFKQNLFSDIVIGEILDVGRRRGKVSFETLRFYMGNEKAPQGNQATKPNSSGLDMLPSKDAGSAVDANERRVNQEQLDICRNAARKILMATNNQIGEHLRNLDQENEGLLTTDKISRAIQDKRIPDLQQSELQFLLSHCDPSGRGFIVIPAFLTKLQELAAETDVELKLRRFAKAIGHQGLNLAAELGKFDTSRNKKMDLQSFKKAMRQLSVAVTDEEVNVLFEAGKHSQGPAGHLDIATFVKKVKDASKAKPLPQFMLGGTSGIGQGSKASATGRPGAGRVGTAGQGTRSGLGSGGSEFENWELEKKYKKNLEALKQEIEERNREIQLVRKEVKDCNDRAQRLEMEKRDLETRLVDRNAKPPREMQVESTNQGALDQIQQLKDEIYYLQQANQALNKTIQVELKAELGHLAQEKEWVEEKLRSTAERLKNKTHEVQQLIGRPMDELVRREEQESARQRQIDELQEQLTQQVVMQEDLKNQLFKAEEKVLDLKFEKETFDLQYARMQKRITDLEQYKLKSSEISASIRSKHEEEMARIKEQSSKLTSDSFAKQPGETVKLRNKSSKSVAELEMVIESLRRVIEKQKIEIDTHKKTIDRQKTLIQKGDNEPALLLKIKQLEQQLHSFEMQDNNLGEQEVTIKKLIFANKQLREDLAREIERYNQLEGKFKDLLVKYNVVSRENDRNKETLFNMQTGAKFNAYSQFLDEDKEFKSKTYPKGYGESYNELDGRPERREYAGGQNLDDSLNMYNREEAAHFRD